MRRTTTKIGGTLAGTLLAVLLVGCGGSSDEDVDPPSAEDTSAPTSAPTSPSASTVPAEPVFFGDAESEVLNEPLASLGESQDRATKISNIRACERLYSDGLKPWRACFHDLLDPVVGDFNAAADAAEGLVRPEFGEKCGSALTTFSEKMRARAAAIEDVLADFDSPRYKDHNAAAGDYYAAVDVDTNKPVVALSNACYSPEVLESVAAEASASASD
ncbi:hypothetical protein [Nocardioides stalactiti]|uniref:hypothetical protein n=1 Tax=Nocardioides stalactiti TaxID=2755356 RepID=UPI0015FEDDC3|nr:hypothetical protein [Nocardioides stalactiti]